LFVLKLGHQKATRFSGLLSKQTYKFNGRSTQCNFSYVPNDIFSDILTPYIEFRVRSFATRK